MWMPLLLSILLVAPIEAPAGTITGSIAPPQNVRFSKPAQVVVFSGKYVDMYAATLQKKIDNYWEDYHQAFVLDKDAFLLFRDRALKQAMEDTLDTMRHDNPLIASGFIRTATNNGFEFRNVPQGECRVVALITIGNREYVWSDSVILTDKPASVTLKPLTP